MHFWTLLKVLLRLRSLLVKIGENSQKDCKKLQLRAKKALDGDFHSWRALKNDLQQQSNCSDASSDASRPIEVSEWKK
jgi:hypothetical protein